MNNGFARRGKGGVAFYSCLAFEEFRDLRHGFSTRFGGVSALPARALNLSRVPWDAPDCVEENRRRFLEAVGLSAAKLLTLRQCHSDRLHIVSDIPEDWNQPAADALATRITGPVLSVQIADCFPILIADVGRTRALAAVHSGRRGTLAGILIKTIRALQSSFGCDPAQLLAAVGPGIRSCCYEVGAEVADRFEERYRGMRLSVERAHRPGRYLLDLRAALEVQFQEAGVKPGNIHDLGACTCCGKSEFFSYRAEGAVSGRMMAVISRVVNQSG